MKVWNQMTRAGVSTLLLAGVVVSGCDNGGGEKRWPSSGWVAPEWDGPTTATRPAPAPAPRQPAPAPAAQPRAAAPAPAMSGDTICLPTGDRATSTICIKCGMPREVTAGSNFDYMIEVCNVTRMTVQNVMVTYSLDGARMVSTDPASTGTGFAVGDLAPGQCKNIKVTASAAGTGSVRGCLGATWNNSLCCTTNVVQPALKIVKSVTPADGTPCSTFTYKVDVTNTGTGAANNVKLADTLPAGVTSDNKTAMNWDLGNIAAGQTVSRTFTAKAGKTGSFTNNATATADNNLSAKSADVAVTIKQPSLTITKVCPGNQRIGRAAAFKVTVSNKGDAPAMNTIVEDTVPAGATFGSATDGGAMAGGKVTWKLGTLAPGASKELGLTLNIAGMGNVQNSASARADCAEAVTANCSFSVQGAPDMRTSLDDGDGVDPVGTNHTYTYEVGNQGQVPLTNVTVKVTLPAGLEFVSAQAGLNPTIAGQVQSYNLGTLAPNQNRTFTFTVKGTKAGEVVVISETRCAEMKSSVRDDEVTNFVE